MNEKVPAVAGVKIPLLGCPPGWLVHEPFNAGVPPKLSTMANGKGEAHTTMLLLRPGSGAMSTATVTVLLSFAQGGMPFTRYVYVPAWLTPGWKIPLK
jgi:hypothetical protein